MGLTIQLEEKEKQEIDIVLLRLSLKYRRYKLIQRDFHLQSPTVFQKITS